MGIMHFLLPASLSAVATRELQRACVVGGPDNMPYPSQVRLDNGRLTVARNVDESGALVVPWELRDAGLLMSASATLIERTAPYLLPVELARGKVNQVRSQLSDWLAGGLQVSAGALQQVHMATLAFTRAVTQAATDQAVKHAQEALALAHGAAEQLAQAYVDQVFQVRQQRMPRLDTALGCRLGTTVPGEPTASAASCEALVQTCNCVCLPFAWNEIEPAESDYNWAPHDAVLDWAESQGVAVAAGPLIDFSKGRLPDWLWLWERDLHSLASFMCDYVETAVLHYRGRIHSWQLTAASNYASLLGLGEDEMLWLTVRLVEAARQADPTLDLVIGISQPWGEYMALEDRTHSPFVFADTLIRSGLNLAALDLELIMGAGPRGSYCRDLLEASRLLDMYALLGVPIRVTLGYPSSDGFDLSADPELSDWVGYWHGGFTPEVQADWATAFAALALCKPTVQGVLWTHFSDAEPHQFPFCGLVDADGNAKPVLQRLRELRAKHLR
jgi:hypothetical protein